jgi:hypothetical protein
MGRMKEEFIKMAEQRFLQSSLFDLMGFVVKEEELKEETFTLNRGDYKTTIIVKFDKNGRPVMHSLQSSYEPSENQKKIKELRLKLNEAIKSEEYLTAQSISEEIKKLETST